MMISGDNVSPITPMEYLYCVFMVVVGVTVLAVLVANMATYVQSLSAQDRFFKEVASGIQTELKCLGVTSDTYRK